MLDITGTSLCLRSIEEGTMLPLPDVLKPEDDQAMREHIYGLSDEDFARHIAFWWRQSTDQYLFQSQEVFEMALSVRTPTPSVFAVLQQSLSSDERSKPGSDDWEQFQRKQAQLLLNFHHIQHITGAEPEAVIAQKRDFNRWSLALMPLGSNMEVDVDLSVLDPAPDEISSVFSCLRAEDNLSIALRAIDDRVLSQVTFVLDNLPEGQLNTDQQMMLVMMTSELDIDTSIFRIRDMINHHVTIPLFVSKKHEEIAKRLVSEIVLNPDLGRAYMDAHTRGDEYSPDQKIEFCRRELDLLAQVCGVEYGTLRIEPLEKGVNGEQEGKDILLQGDSEEATFFAHRDLSALLGTIRHEYGHILEEHKVTESRLNDVFRVPQGGDQLDWKNFSDVMALAKQTYVTTVSAEAIFREACEHTRYKTYERQLNEQHAIAFSRAISEHIEAIPMIYAINKKGLAEGMKPEFDRMIEQLESLKTQGDTTIKFDQDKILALQDRLGKGPEDISARGHDTFLKSFVSDVYDLWYHSEVDAEASDADKSIITDSVLDLISSRKRFLVAHSTLTAALDFQAERRLARHEVEPDKA